MLFYTQIKREFSQISWKRGQTYFRDNRVSDVRLDGDLVYGKVQGTADGAYDTAIQMARGSIFNSKCTCPVHRKHETHCKHVAALAIWIVERGSLLRAGIVSQESGAAAAPSREDEVVIKDFERVSMEPVLRRLLLTNPVLKTGKFRIRRDKMAGSLEGVDVNGYPFSIPITLLEVGILQEHVIGADEALGAPKAIEAKPVLYVKGLFQNMGKVFAGIAVESALEYEEPDSGRLQIHTLSYLTKGQDDGIFKTGQGVFLKVKSGALSDPDLPEDASALEILASRRLPNFIEQLNQGRVIHQGQAGLDELARLLAHPLRKQMVFDPQVDLKIEKQMLKLVGLEIGARVGKNRQLKYKFRGPGFTLSSEELEQYAFQGRLSANYLWHGEKLYRFQTGLDKLDQFANRSGLPTPDKTEEAEDQDGQLSRAHGFGTLYDAHDAPLHPICAYRLSLELGVKDFEVDEAWTEFHEWRKNFERKQLPKLPKVDYGFKLRGYQKNGLEWLWSLYHRGLSALLADDMGLGKTHQVLALLTSIYAPKGGGKKLPAKGKKAAPAKATVKSRPPTLVVAPTSVIAAWIQKLKKYETGLQWHVFHGSNRVMPEDKHVDIVLTTYGILQREAMLREKSWHIVVLDEAQAIKNMSTISARASRSLIADYKIAMTGTPVENQPTDLWSLVEFLLPGYLGTLARFKRIYGSYTRGEPMPEVQAMALRRLVTPFLLRRTKATVLKELPVKTEEVISCELTDAQKKAYQRWLDHEDAERAREELEAGKKVDYANVLAVLTRLKQVCDHPSLPELTGAKAAKLAKIDPLESGKWETMFELIEEAVRSELKVVIFTQYLTMMDMIGLALFQLGIGFTELRGDTQDRASRLEKFANDPDCKVFVCSLLAGGLGIDLTAGSVCIHLDRWWNPARENQATDRLHRMGQTRGVQVFKLQIPGTVEDRIASIIESKIALSGALIEESSTGLKAFSRTQLLEILSPKFLKL